MEHYDVILTKKARADIQAAIRYIARDLREPATAAGMLDRFKVEIMSLQTMPERFGLVPDEYLASLGIRMTAVGSYLIFYVVNHGEHRVYVPRVLYGRRNWIEILTKDNL